MRPQHARTTTEGDHMQRKITDTEHLALYKKAYELLRTLWEEDAGCEDMDVYRQWCRANAALGYENKEKETDNEVV